MNIDQTDPVMLPPQGGVSADAGMQPRNSRSLFRIGSDIEHLPTLASGIHPLFFFFLFILFGYPDARACTTGRSIPDSATTVANPKVSGRDSLPAGASIDSSKNSGVSADSSHVPKVLEIGVSPAEASGADVMVVQTSAIEITPGSSTTIPVGPDTLGRWKAPMRLILGYGVYLLTVTKEGFRDELKKITFDGEKSGRVQVELLSLSFLQAKRDQWNSYMWMSAAVAAVAGGATAYFGKQVDNYSADYHAAISPDRIHDLRGSIDRNRSAYTIASATAIAAVSAGVIALIVQFIYR